MLVLNLCLPFNLLPLGGYISSTGELSIRGVESPGAERLASGSPQPYAFEKGALPSPTGRSQAGVKATARAWGRRWW